MRRSLILLCAGLVAIPVLVVFYQYTEILELPAPASVEKINPNGHDVTLIYNGGHNSCIRAPSAAAFNAGQWPANYQELAKTLSQASKASSSLPRLIYTCIYLSPNDLYMMDSAAQKQQYRRLSLAEYFDYLGAIPQDRFALFMGHSYGAWITMQSALRYQGQHYALLTMDPISPIDCNYLGGLLQFFVQGEAVGCKQAPKNIDETKLAILSSKAAYWLNAYQNSFPYIHSSGLPFAENILVADMKGLPESFLAIANPQNAHKKIRTLGSIWEHFRRSLGHL